MDSTQSDTYATSITESPIWIDEKVNDFRGPNFLHLKLFTFVSIHMVHPVLFLY